MWISNLKLAGRPASLSERTVIKALPATPSWRARSGPWPQSGPPWHSRSTCARSPPAAGNGGTHQKSLALGREGAGGRRRVPVPVDELAEVRHRATPDSDGLEGLVDGQLGGQVRLAVRRSQSDQQPARRYYFEPGAIIGRLGRQGRAWARGRGRPRVREITGLRHDDES